MNLKFEEDRKRERRIQILKESVRFVIELTLVILIAWLIIQFALKKVSVIGSAMESTLYNGEDVMVNKTAYAILSPGRDSIIAFYPEQKEDEQGPLDDSSILIRRVVGLPGERLQIKEGKIYINGEVIEEKYEFPDMLSAGCAINEITLGEDEYFVLSDNRADMDDSRNTAFTKVKKENIIGKVILRLNPFSLIGGPKKDETKDTDKDKG